MKWKEQLLNLTPYQPGKSIEEVKKQYGLNEIIKLASNENPFGCSPNATAAINQPSSFFSLYPDGYATNLRNAVAEDLKVAPEQIIFGNGSDETIMMLSRALLGPGTNTVMPAPTFPQYKHNAIIEGAEVREIPLVDAQHDLQAMLAAIDEKTAIVWLCSPNNPTGTYIPDQDLRLFINQVPEDVLVVLDEAYCEYVTVNDFHNSVELVKDFPNVIALRTFSKIYGLASLRIGYGIGQPELIRAMEPVREPFNANRFAQVVAIQALNDKEFIETCRQANQEGLTQYYQFCDEEGLKYFPSQGNFILIDFNVDGNEVFQYLLERGYIVRSGKVLGFPTGVRVTVGSREQNEGLIKMMKQFIRERASLS
ncbi:histidinol-phosphate transaminase [Cytobacillus purgationiresistens]|uniref:Histidinol-phosphate aminotransferase n=1 Tax=Cytobacillus purgationiresistens TaxID=863449 RepID=A0ABU0AII9_9BACI|nr:histidinol-phosphate transaminase [Cytobacillus purgationiresistens]MDQ0271075.1 histidinol-phosphate aminotransferase [Cytobacillus purgationiresistens]